MVFILFSRNALWNKPAQSPNCAYPKKPGLRENLRLGTFAVVVLNDAQAVPATDDDRLICAWFRNWKWLVDPLMRASGMVVIDICAQDTPQMGFIENEPLVQACFVYRSYPTFS